MVVELGRWGANFMDQPRRRDTINAGWGLLALKRRYRGGVDAVVELRLGERRFELAFEKAHLHVKEREAIRPQLIVAGPLEAFQAWLFKGIAAADLQRAASWPSTAIPRSGARCRARSAPTTGRAPGRNSLSPPGGERVGVRDPLSDLRLSPRERPTALTLTSPLRGARANGWLGPHVAVDANAGDLITRRPAFRRSPRARR